MTIDELREELQRIAPDGDATTLYSDEIGRVRLPGLEIIAWYRGLSGTSDMRNLRIGGTFYSWQGLSCQEFRQFVVGCPDCRHRRGHHNCATGWPRKRLLDGEVNLPWEGWTKDLEMRGGPRSRHS